VFLGRLGAMRRGGRGWVVGQRRGDGRQAPVLGGELGGQAAAVGDQVGRLLVRLGAAGGERGAGGFVQLQPARRDGVAPPALEWQRQLAEPLAEDAERPRLGVGQPPPVGLADRRGGEARQLLPGGVALGDDRCQRAQVRGRRPVAFHVGAAYRSRAPEARVVTPETETARCFRSLPHRSGSPPSDGTVLSRIRTRV
jgi:hypothetical protein